MSMLYKFTLVAGMMLAAPALAQMPAKAPIGSEQNPSNMPKSSETIPDRVRTLDPDGSNEPKVRSDLADPPQPSVVNTAMPPQRIDSMWMIQRPPL